MAKKVRRGSILRAGIVDRPLVAVTIKEVGKSRRIRALVQDIEVADAEQFFVIARAFPARKLAKVSRVAGYFKAWETNRRSPITEAVNEGRTFEARRYGLDLADLERVVRRLEDRGFEVIAREVGAVGFRTPYGPHPRPKPRPRPNTDEGERG